MCRFSTLRTCLDKQSDSQALESVDWEGEANLFMLVHFALHYQLIAIFTLNEDMMFGEALNNALQIVFQILQAVSARHLLSRAYQMGFVYSPLPNWLGLNISYKSISLCKRMRCYIILALKQAALAGAFARQRVLFKMFKAGTRI